jgi:hypothetical protein
VSARSVLVAGHPTIDTRPCVFGHYEVRVTELHILSDNGLTHWRTARTCLRCNPVSTGQRRILPGGGIDTGAAS